ncbi:hypothetical protein [Nocardiopsis sp. B62]|uniref:hypothetical protein n=1 Tax=Nocardiopsis sp. B62 TaxID=2824874 RepID=UPI001B37FCC6|nr:hypothetical protein [Nocardiopsis sp. B62]MBQ1083777.1 hypothetical protein [Nocardiopsis sp. B62]
MGASEAESADSAANATRPLARVALAAVVSTVLVGSALGGTVPARPEVAAALVVALVAALAATSGLTGPLLSRHTSALAMAVPGLVVALSAELPAMDLPGMAGVFVWSMLLPVVPVMLLGQVWLYRMTRRPVTASSFFA